MWMTHLLFKNIKDRFLEHSNSIDACIKFTVEDKTEDGSMPLSDTLVMSEPDRSLSAAVYRKSTHTDQHLQWNIHHNLPAKYYVINTLTHCPRLSAQPQSCLKGKRSP